MLIFATGFGSSSVNAQTYIKTPQVIRVVVDNDYAPYSFQSDEGKLQGILIDQWRAWEKRTGTTVDIYGMDWSEALLRMRSGDFDVIDCIVETAERQKYFEFTQSYNTVEASIYFQQDIPGVTDLISVRGFSVGAKVGDQHIDKLKENGVTNVIQFENNEAIIKAANEKKINVFLMDNPSAIYLLNKREIASEFRHSAPIFHDELRRAVRKGDVALLNVISGGFAAIESSELKKIDEKWFGQSVHSYGSYLAYTSYVVVAALFVLIGLIVWNRMLRKAVLLRTIELAKSEQRFRKSEDGVRLIIDTIPIMAWTTEANGVVDFLNQRWIDYAGLTLEQYVKNPMGLVHPDDVARVMEKWLPKMEAEEQNEDEMRLRAADGEYHWFLVRQAPLHDKQGNLIKWYGVSLDIDNSKQLNAELRRLSSHLQNIQENERASIAREIHDELGQLLTGLKMEVGWLNKKLPDDAPLLKDKGREVLSLVGQTLKTVKRIAMDLRPNILDELGLIAALEWQGLEFEKARDVKFQFYTNIVDFDPDRTLSTNIFRVHQEALTNIARHAQATEIKTTLEKKGDVLLFKIKDNGNGFNIEAEKSINSIGLIGMKERALMLHGDLTIESEKRKGTVITLRVPFLKPEKKES